jgi:hypothetical protein
MAENRKKIKWATRKRKGGMRVWKSKWVTLNKPEGKAER